MRIASLPSEPSTWQGRPTIGPKQSAAISRSGAPAPGAKKATAAKDRQRAKKDRLEITHGRPSGRPVDSPTMTSKTT
jgi:hypothetical protein